jgi:hypothetical protein
MNNYVSNSKEKCLWEAAVAMCAAMQQVPTVVSQHPNDIAQKALIQAEALVNRMILL